MKISIRADDGPRESSFNFGDIPDSIGTLTFIVPSKHPGCDHKAT